ncbi:phage tail protein [Paenibacillus sp. 481]|uniref:phage tail protein n=1 Tax=Paenibacillus sp. 481 TaxID=2835869 RepID=UPI001E38D407|nr:phage tail protein [Paenibacillus sp. 481]UHA73467.1 phage tail protein [Paenibacillus sp. 481]
MFDQPSGTFRFIVYLQGINGVIGFTEVRGLQVETEFEEYREGGVNDFVHRLPKKTTSPVLVLKRGITMSNALWQWYCNVTMGKIERKNGTIVLQRQDGQPLCSWDFVGAYPTKWVGTDLKSDSKEIAIETLELVHNGLKTVFISE